MATYVVLILLFSFEMALGDKLLQPKKKCVPTATIQGACHVCVCHMDGVYQCQRQPCEHGIEDINPKLRECEANELYREDTTFCTCGPSGHWRSINCRDKFHRLPLKKDPMKKNLRTNIPCKPNNLYITDCNVCYCDASGVISFSSCTGRPCPKRYKGDFCTPGEVYRSANEFCICSYVNYYIDQLCLKVVDEVVQPVNSKDLAQIVDFRKSYSAIDFNYCTGNATLSVDCNTCVCQNNKFLCTKNVCSDDRPVLRSEDKVVLELKSEFDKCIPGKSYQYKCNTCVCNRKGEPLCTSMICLQDIVADSTSLRQMIVSY